MPELVKSMSSLLIKTLPLAVHRPGQETRNSDFLLESGAAIKINNVATLPYKVTKLLADPKQLRQLRDNVRRIARPRAAFDVVEKSLELIK